MAQLETICFSAPWSITALESELHNPLSFWLVCIEGSQVLGYVGSQTVMPEADIMNLAVLPEFRRQGIGKALLTNMISALGERGVIQISLEVRPSNASAVSLYEKMGFVQVGRRPGYYRNPKEDALILRKELISCAY